MFQGKKPVLHGRKVGVGTVEVCKLYERLINSKIDFKGARDLAKNFSLESWNEDIRKVYTSASEGVIELENNAHKNISSILEKLNAPSKYEDIEVSKEMYKNSIVYTKELRNRLGLLQILYDLKISYYYD